MTFDAGVSSLANMRSPPPCLRPLVDRLNRTPTRTSRAATVIKTEPIETPIQTSRTATAIKVEPKDTPSVHSSDSADSGPLVLAPIHQSIIRHGNHSGSAPSSASTRASETSIVSQALVNLLNPPEAGNANTAPTLDFRGCRVEIHFHVHPNSHPVLPTPCPRTERLKRKRDSSDVDQVVDGEDVLERQVKKMKLSHESEAGYRIRGQAKVRRRSERVTAAEGVKARSKSGLRRMSSRGVEAGRLRR